MVLAYAAERVTRDIDAYFEPRAAVTAAAAAVATDHSLPPNWLSDAVRTVWPDFRDPSPRVIWEAPGVTIAVVSPAYLLTMKAMTGRRSQADLEDAARLCQLLGISDEATLERVIRQNMPTEAPFGAQELFFEDIIDRARGIAAGSHSLPGGTLVAHTLVGQADTDRSITGPICGQWLPRAHRSCTLPAGHKGQHR
jgi:hypothetical protein